MLFRKLIFISLEIVANAFNNLAIWLDDKSDKLEAKTKEIRLKSKNLKDKQKNLF